MIVIWWLHRKGIATSTLWRVIRRRYLKPSSDSQVTIIWWLHWEITMTVALWQVLKWHQNEIARWSVTEQRSQEFHGRVAKLRSLKSHQVTIYCDVDWDSSGCISHSDCTVESQMTVIWDSPRNFIVTSPAVSCHKVWLLLSQNYGLLMRGLIITSTKFYHCFLKVIFPLLNLRIRRIKV